MPLGLHHLMNGSHYGPGPWQGAPRPDWTPAYYHKADTCGIGFDRTEATGTGNTAQYPQPQRSQYEDIASCPENLILWFHHLPWDYTMKNGETLWNALCHTYQQGIDATAAYIDTWTSVRKYVDNWRWNQINDKLIRQAKDALWWRDACIGYFQQFSGMELPSDCSPVQHSYDDLHKFRLRISNYETPAPDALPEYELP